MERIVASLGAGDPLYMLLGAGILAIIGFALVMKAGNKLGWLLVVGACAWAWVTLQPTIQAARRGSAAPAGSAYYNVPKR